MNLVNLTIPPTLGAEIASCIVLLCMRDIFFPERSETAAATVTTSKSTYLYKRKNNRLSEHRPVTSAVLYYKSRNAYCRSAVKKCLMKWRRHFLQRRNRKHQQNTSQKDHTCKSQNNQLKRRQVFFLTHFSGINNHNSLLMIL